MGGDRSSHISSNFRLPQSPSPFCILEEGVALSRATVEAGLLLLPMSLNLLAWARRPVYGLPDRKVAGVLAQASVSVGSALH